MGKRRPMSAKESKASLRAARDRHSLPAEEYFKIGDKHPAWPEWRWDGERFVRL